MSNSKVLFCGNNKDFLAEELIKDSNNSNCGTAFRIPAIIKTNNTLIAVADKASCDKDWGYIELACRTSKDNGETWSDIKTIATPPAREIQASADCCASAFFIDPCLTVAPNGDVILLVTFFPESKGIHDKQMLDKKKIAYSYFNGELNELLYDREGKFYIISKDGKVLDAEGNETEYKVADWKGTLLKGNEDNGNIYLNGPVGKTTDKDTYTTFGAPLKTVRRSYLFMLKSSDNGETWSDPINISDNLIKTEEGSFLGICPGAGVTTKSGRIIVPAYTLDHAVVIYSDDNGNTWRRMPMPAPLPGEWAPAQTSEGRIYAVGRSNKYNNIPVAYSDDNGVSWIKASSLKAKAPKCQKSIIAIDNTLYVAHPSAKTRSNGVISKAKLEINEKKNKIKGLSCNPKEDIKINDGFFAYSSIVEIDDNKLGILYEDQPSSHIVFETINL